MHSLFNAAQHHYSSSLRGMSPLEASRVYKRLVIEAPLPRSGARRRPIAGCREFSLPYMVLSRTEPALRFPAPRPRPRAPRSPG